jgi:hypothetical protein
MAQPRRAGVCEIVPGDGENMVIKAERGLFEKILPSGSIIALLR